MQIKQDSSSDNDKMTTKLVGRWGEELAARCYRKHGWKILAMGYHCRFGEIDVIAEKKGLVAFVEVKLRRDDRFASAADQVNGPKQRRLRATAELWMSQYGEGRNARFDVVEVYAKDGLNTKRPEVHVIEDAFE